MSTKDPKDQENLDVRSVEVPEGYVFSEVPKSKLEAISKDPAGYDKIIVRSALEAYLRQWLDTDGRNRQLLGNLVPPSINYVTDKNFDSTEDPISKRILLARVFNELRQSAPALLITDTGVEYKSSGLGDYAAGRYDRTLKKHILDISTNIDVNIEIIIISQDEETTQTLYSMLLYILGSARRLGNGNTLTPIDRNHRWVVRLPLQFSQGGVQNQNITEDPKDQFWTGSVSLMVQYESLRSVSYSTVLPFDPYQKRTADGGIAARHEVGTSMSQFFPKILSPSVMRVNMPERAFITRMLHLYVVYVDKPSIATVHPESFMITPRRPGTFTLFVAKRNLDDGKMEILDSQEITVRL